MAIKVSFGTTDKDLRYIDKAPQWKKQNLDCDVYEPVDRLNPTIIVDANTTNVDIKECNYMYIPEFGRYYNVTSIVGAPGKKYYISGHVDVLYTYREQIQECECIAERSTSNYSLYLQDNRRLFKSYVQNDYYELGDLGLPRAVVLVTIGQEASS